MRDNVKRNKIKSPLIEITREINTAIVYYCVVTIHFLLIFNIQPK